MPDFLEEIKKRDILWFMGAVRAKTISPELIEKCKDSGCVTIGYGHETGSEKMLNIMEKKTTQEDNVNAQKWAINAGFYSSVIQLVIGMPGEDISTIKETANFTQYSYTLSKHLNPFSISINYAQALPGTDFYEYGRRMGLIGKNIDDEEQYLIEVSDHNAGSSDTLNFTNYPMNVYLSWKYYILFGTVSAYVKKFGFRHLIMKINNKGPIDTNHDYKNISFLKDLLNYKNSFRVIIYLLLFKINFILPTLSLLKLYKNKPKKIIKHTADYFKYLMGNYKESNKLNLNKSLRKVIKNNELPYIETDIPEMIPLRKGR